MKWLRWLCRNWLAIQSPRCDQPVGLVILQGVAAKSPLGETPPPLPILSSVMSLPQCAFGLCPYSGSLVTLVKRSQWLKPGASTERVAGPQVRVI